MSRWFLTAGPSQTHRYQDVCSDEDAWGHFEKFWIRILDENYEVQLDPISPSLQGSTWWLPGCQVARLPLAIWETGDRCLSGCHQNKHGVNISSIGDYEVEVAAGFSVGTLSLHRITNCCFDLKTHFCVNSSFSRWISIFPSSSCSQSIYLLCDVFIILYFLLFVIFNLFIFIYSHNLFICS